MISTWGQGPFLPIVPQVEDEDMSHYSNDASARNDYSPASHNRRSSTASIKEIMTVPQFVEDPEIENLLKTIKVHETYLKLCTTTQQYIEAEETKGELVELKLKVVTLKLKELEMRHQEEKQKLEELQKIEAEDQRFFWDAKIIECEQNAISLLEAAIEKHRIDAKGLEDELRRTLRLKLLVNPERIKNQRLLENLVRSKEFTQAERLKAKSISLEKEEVQKAEEIRDSKIRAGVQQLLRKQKIELNALESKVKSGLANLQRTKELESDKMRVKFQTMYKEVERAQQAELVKFETLYKNYIPGRVLSFVNKEARFKKSGQSSMYLKQDITPRRRSISPVAVRTPEKKSRVLTPLKNATPVNGSQSKSPRTPTPTQKRAVTPTPKRSKDSTESKVQIGASSKKSLTPVKNKRY